MLIINTEISKERAMSSVSILIGHFFHLPFPVDVNILQQFKGKYTPEEYSFNWNTEYKMLKKKKIKRESRECTRMIMASPRFE